MTFHRRLTLYGTSIAAATTIVLWIVLLVVTTLGARGEQRNTLEQASLDALAEIDPSGNLPTQFDSADVADTADVVVTTFRDGVFTPALSPGGSNVAITPDILESADTDGATFTTITVNGQPIQMSLRATSQDDFYIAALQTRLVADAATEELVPAMLIATVVILIAAYRASSVVARRAITPLEQIASYSATVRETGDTSRQLIVERRGREIDDVVESFNSMVSQLGRSLDRTAAALASQRRFVSDASHELRTPLTTIRTNAAFLTDRPDASEPDRSEALADIVSESERMSTLTNRLLDLARADADAQALERSDVDLGAIARDVARQASTADRPVRAIGEVRADVDRDLTTRLLWILVDNALVHGAGTVTIESDCTSTTTFITVTDEGPGIPPADRHAVFQRFRRAEGSARRGSGLGLAMAKEIVDAHEGTISIDESAGAVVLIQLPRT